jgi:hypothetical protein
MIVAIRFFTFLLLKDGLPFNNAQSVPDLAALPIPFCRVLRGSIPASEVPTDRNNAVT